MWTRLSFERDQHATFNQRDSQIRGQGEGWGKMQVEFTSPSLMCLCCLFCSACTPDRVARLRSCQDVWLAGFEFGRVSLSYQFFLTWTRQFEGRQKSGQCQINKQERLNEANSCYSNLHFAAYPRRSTELEKVKARGHKQDLILKPMSFKVQFL